MHACMYVPHCGSCELSGVYYSRHGGGAKYVSMDGPTYYPYIRLHLCITEY